MTARIGSIGLGFRAGYVALLRHVVSQGLCRRKRLVVSTKAPEPISPAMA
jgi:hypothetical protein